MAICSTWICTLMSLVSSATVHRAAMRSFRFLRKRLLPFLDRRRVRRPRELWLSYREVKKKGQLCAEKSSRRLSPRLTVRFSASSGALTFLNALISALKYSA